MTDYKSRIESNYEVMLGKPVIKNTRITVETILMKLASGYSPEEMVKMYTTISVEDVFACMAYAAAVIQNEAIIEPNKAA